MKKTALTILLSLILALPAGAQHINPQMDMMRERLEQLRIERSTQNEQNTNDGRLKTREGLKTARDEAKNEARKARDAFKATLQERRAEMHTRIQSEREQFHNKIKSVKDEKKKAIAERLEMQLNAFNTRMVNHFEDVLDRLTTVLTRIIERRDRAEEAGHDVSSVDEAIEKAEDAIDDARAAILEQTSKTYTPVLGEEDSLRASVGLSRKALHDDLTALRNIIRNTYTAVHEVATTLAHIEKSNGNNDNANKNEDAE